MMFDLPDAKRVRRGDIYSRSPSHELSDLTPDLEARFHDQLSKIYKPDTRGGELSATDKQYAEEKAPILNNGQALEDEGYEFRLFSNPSAKFSDSATVPNTGPQRIVLRSPTPTNGDPGFLNPRRSDHYYFTGPTSLEKMEQYRIAAVTGEELAKGLDVHWPGAALPWRVTTIESPSLRKPSRPAPPADTSPSKRKRSGKKRRIAIRTKTAATLAKNIANKQRQAEKEAAEKEKRTKRNREKKVKRKVKDKLKRVQANVGDS